MCGAALLSLVTLLQRISHHTSGVPVSPASYLADVVKTATFTGAAVLSQYERGRAVTASRLQLVYWGTTLGLHIIPAYSLIIQEVHRDDLLGFTVFYIQFFLFLLMTVLNCFSEHRLSPKRRGYHILGKEECPDIYASAFSKMFFIWMLKIIKTGYRRVLADDDVWELLHELKTDTNLPTFERLWTEEERRCHGHAMKDVAYFPGDLGSNRIFTEKSKLIDQRHSIYTNVLHENDRDKDNIPKPSLFKVMFQHFWARGVSFFGTKLIADLLGLVGPMLLQMLIGYMEHRTPINSWQGYCICILMFMVGQTRIVIHNYSMYSGFKLAMIIKSVLISSIFKKSMRVKSQSEEKASVGDVVNLMSVDAQRIMEFTIKIAYCITMPVQIVVAISFIYSSIGPAALVGLCVLLLLIPINIWIADKQRILLQKNLGYKDDRIRMVNESLGGIKVLKMYAWETSFHDRIQTIRAMEITTLLKIATYYVFSGVLWGLAGYLVTLSTFATYSLSDRTNYLDASRAFTTLTFFNILRTPMDMMASMIGQAAQTYVSICRINEFLLTEELDNSNVIESTVTEHVVSFENTELTWDVNSRSNLRNITLHTPQGRLVAIVGPVGSGKSSLISAILGDMTKINGEVSRKGSMALVSQQAWIQNATVRDNIVFGKTFNKKRYEKVVNVCELERDFAILTVGDQTEIGEKGINLSGGQKQRVSLARAVYHDSDLYLLDDPLSAVDSHVGKALFDNVIGPKGMLKKKTRILVTHQVQFLSQVDQIVVMEDGKIRETGTYGQLLAHNGDFAKFMKTHLVHEQFEHTTQGEHYKMSVIKNGKKDGVAVIADNSNIMKFRRTRKESYQSEDSLDFISSDRCDSSLILSCNENFKSRQQQGKLVTTETMEQGKVKASVYGKYVRAAGVLPFCISVFMYFCFYITSVLGNFWLSAWTQDPFISNRANEIDDLSAANDQYIFGYGMFGILMAVFMLVFYYLYWTRMVVAGRKLHSDMTSRLFRAPMSFFDTVPTGRILNRCSRDIEVVDNFLPLIIRDFFTTASLNIVTIIVIMVETPEFGAFMVPIIALFFLVLKFYIPTARQLRRMENVSRSPIFSHFSESLSGSSTIRAYGAMNAFIGESTRRLDKNIAFNFAGLAITRWMTLNLDTLGNLVVLASGILQVLSSTTDPGLAGLTLSYAFTITGALPVMLNAIADLETLIVSVERVKEYTELPQESEWIVNGKRPMPDWPSDGVVEFKNFSVRYREGLDLVIRGLSFRLEAGEKVGIVGRTGAGKSSLSLSLFRLMEAAGGSILIDGLNIAHIGLHDLRSRVTILPQDPVLFSGSLRLNLDPFDEFSDEELWTALDRAHLKTLASQSHEGLLYHCGDEGQNLSVGQRQLVCLARTLLRKTKVLVLDEATAAVDLHTDSLIQKTIREAFTDCTVLAIAHRLNTIMDYDKVLVLEAGRVREFDTPATLLADRHSAFYSMAADANIV